MVSYSKQERHQAMAAHPRLSTLGGTVGSLLAKSYAYREISKVDAAQGGIHRLDQPRIAFDIGRVSSCFFEEVIERQRTMPLQVLSESHKVISHGWVIYPYPCGVPSAHTHSPCLCAVHSEEPPMGEDRLGLTQRTRGF